MKPVIESFIDELKQNNNTRGILIFGSYARGDQRENSDVDVLVLVKEGAWRDVEMRNGQVFEMVYAGPKEAKSFYASNPNDAVQQWNDGLIVYDRDGEMEKLKLFVADIGKMGKPALNMKQIAHFKFDKEDKISAIESLKDTDLATANLYLQNLALEALELYFDLRQLWTPSPKLRLKYLRKHDSNMAGLFDEFYTSQNFYEQLKMIKQIIPAIFL